MAHCTIGEIDQAVKIFEEWLDEDPGDPIARHMLAAARPRDSAARLGGFVADLRQLRHKLRVEVASLAYRAPALVVAMLEDSGLQQSKNLDVLDAGCGTGLCGPMLAPYASRLWGSIFPPGCWIERRRRRSTTSSCKAS